MEPYIPSGRSRTFESKSLEFRRAIEQQKRMALEKEKEDRLREPALSGSVPPALSVLVENVRSLWNVGSILRTADGAGFGSVHLCGITGIPPRREISKVSLGAENYVSWRHCLDPLVVLSELKNNGAMLVGLEYTSCSLPLSSVLAAERIKSPLCLVVGNEEKGISAGALELCDVVCHLPMRGIKTSLNVAVAFGVAAYFIAGWLEECAADESRARS